MPSFDVVSEVNLHEVRNAVDQAGREVATRFDFKGSQSSYTLTDDIITLQSESEFQLKQMQDILESKLIKRNVDIASLDINEPAISGKLARQQIKLRQGIDAPLARKIVKIIKDSNMKVQAAIQGDKVRITGKKRDDLQQAISLIRDAKFDLPLQYENFRD